MEPVYRAALALGTANQLTNILRDVGEDIRERNRIYVPLEDLARFNITEKEVRCSWLIFLNSLACPLCNVNHQMALGFLNGSYWYLSMHNVHAV